VLKIEEKDWFDQDSKSCLEKASLLVFELGLLE
jgi:hypothetical protein